MTAGGPIPAETTDFSAGMTLRGLTVMGSVGRPTTHSLPRGRRAANQSPTR
ncbi:hypothetical protein [Streptomyces sp. AM8-1-1]|uniref:hypothetical protein n=1 Tax=Streptomyces sp. AM8-1-1 TaxID=3075825 RepID=UPI0028C40F45|nr:hypothetical protein [Streptomyces sp. AM8-1-1]WNO74901.1 hypothetical protein RPQ07_26275 [Streptomyces sp. AM8-1-1]